MCNEFTRHEYDISLVPDTKPATHKNDTQSHSTTTRFSVPTIHTPAIHPSILRAAGGLTLGGALALGAHQVDHALVHLDAGDHVALLEQLHERCAVVSLLVQGLVEEDHARNVVAHHLVGGEEQLGADVRWSVRGQARSERMGIGQQSQVARG